MPFLFRYSRQPRLSVRAVYVLSSLHLFMRFYCRASIYLRRKRFAFAVTPRWNGATIDAAEAPLRSANPDKARACCFSSTILANSVGEHLPCASIQLLRAIVSHEENIISVIIAGNRTAWSTCDSLRERTWGVLRLVFFIKKNGSGFYSQVAAGAVGNRLPIVESWEASSGDIHSYAVSHCHASYSDAVSFQSAGPVAGGVFPLAVG